MRAQVAGLEAVLADGTVISRLTGLAKDNTGYDLPQLIAGSEGTLAVVTRVRLRLVPLLPARAVALVALADLDAALALLSCARRLTTLSAAEFILADGLDLVREYARLPLPFATPYPVYVVLECAARTDPTDGLLEMLAECPAVADATAASDATGRARESHTEAINAAGVPVKLDVCVRVRALPEMIAQLPGVVATASAKARPIVFGHLNEGNLHINVLDAGGAADGVTDAVLRLVAAHEGSISSEHGIGTAKAPWLELSRTPEEIGAMRRIKAALDPAGLLNPGVLLRG